MTTAAVSFSAFTSAGPWVQILTDAGIFTLLALGLQMNVGYTGIVNFGQVGFSALGGYSLGILVLKAHIAFVPACFLAILITMLIGALIAIPTLRLRADYFAIATIAGGEIVRYVAQNARGLTGGNLGLLGNNGTNFTSPWSDFAQGTVRGWLQDLGWVDPDRGAPLLMLIVIVLIVITALLWLVQRTPWGRVLRAVREDEDAARALGKNTLIYKIQSLAISAGVASIAGIFLALQLAFLTPDAYKPQITFIAYACLVLGGLANYWAVPVGAFVMWLLLDGVQDIDLPISADRLSALRFIFVGLLLILLMAFRPQGIFGNRQEMVLEEN
jgi:branched-chain amino acid transport system permease protein